MKPNEANIISGPSILGEVWYGAIQQAVTDALRSAGTKPKSNRDRLLTADEAAQMLSVSPDWLYRNAKKLPFTRKLGPKMLRFDYRGMVKWIETRKLL
jgi:predicted DNA-binding transcriptional regulator AlpA